MISDGNMEMEGMKNTRDDEQMEEYNWIVIVQTHLKVVCCVCMATHHVQLFVTPWTAACQAPLSMECSRQEYWSELSFPSSEDLPDPGVEPIFPAFTGEFFTIAPPGKPHLKIMYN